MTTKFQHRTIVIGVPVYNEERHVGATIQSLMDQEWTDFLVVIADNASTDRTAKICKRLIEKDSRFHYVAHEANIGAAFNFRFILDSSESPYFMWLGGHDMIAPTFLSTHIGALENRPECSLSYSYTQWIDEDGEPLRITKASSLCTLGGGGLRRYLRSIGFLSECTAINNVIRRRAAEAGLIQNVAGFDHVFLSNLLFYGPANCVSDPLYIRRMLDRERDDAMLRLTGMTGIRKDVADLERLYVENFWQLSMSRIKKAAARPLLSIALSRKFHPEHWQSLPRSPRRQVRKRQALIRWPGSRRSE